MEPGDEKYAVVQVTVNFPDSTTQEPKASYTNINQVLKDYPVMVGNIVYEFYEDIAYKNLINILEKTYNSCLLYTSHQRSVRSSPIRIFSSTSSS